MVRIRLDLKSANHPISVWGRGLGHCWVAQDTRLGLHADDLKKHPGSPCCGPCQAPMEHPTQGLPRSRSSVTAASTAHRLAERLIWHCCVAHWPASGQLLMDGTLCCCEKRIMSLLSEQPTFSSRGWTCWSVLVHHTAQMSEGWLWRPPSGCASLMLFPVDCSCVACCGWRVLSACSAAAPPGLQPGVQLEMLGCRLQ